MLNLIFILLAHWNNSSWVDMSPYSDILSRFRTNKSVLLLLNDTYLAEKQQMPIVLSLILPDQIRAQTHNLPNHIGGVMVSVLASSEVDCRFEPQSGQTKDYKIDIWCFSAKHAALRRKSKNWLAHNQNNVSEWCDMSTRGLLLQWPITIKIQLSVLV